MKKFIQNFVFILFSLIAPLNTIPYIGFLQLPTPFTQNYVFNLTNLFINTGPIPNLPAGCSFVFGSVSTKSDLPDHMNFFFGDSQNLVTPYLAATWYDAPNLNVGGRLVALTNSGDGEAYTGYFGMWWNVMIPLKSDGSFDIFPTGLETNNNYVGFNLIYCT